MGSPGLGDAPLSPLSPMKLPSLTSAAPGGENEDNKEEDGESLLGTKQPLKRGKNFKEVMSTAYKEN